MYLKRNQRHKEKYDQPDTYTSRKLLQDINEMRVHLGLRKIEFIERTCLKCGILFKAQKRIGDFMCDECGLKHTGDENQSWEAKK